MNIIQRIKQYISPSGEAAVNDVPAIVGDLWSRHSFTPVTNWPQAYAMWKANPIAQGCTLAYSLMMPEAQIGVIQPDGTYDYEQPIIELLTRDQWRVTMAEIMTTLCIGGNAYGYKLRNSRGAVIGIRWYNDKRFAPVNDGWADVSHYLYYDGMQSYRVEKSDVVHLVGFWYDPEKPMGGGSPIDMASQSIEGFNEASSTVFNIHKNDAMPKTVVIYDEELTTDQIAAAERTFKRKYGGDRRGAVGHMWGIKDIKRLALDWSEMGLSDTFGQYETRICGVYRVHPIIAFTHAGLATSTYSNFEQASKDFTTMSRVPFWNLIAEQLNAQLALPDFGVQIGFDLSTVQALAGQAIATEAVGMVDDDTEDDITTLSLKGGAALKAAPFQTFEELTSAELLANPKTWLQSPDKQVYIKAMDTVLTDVERRLARAWTKELTNLQKAVIGQKTLVKAEDINEDIWRKRFVDATEDERNELVTLALTLAAEEVDYDGEPGEFGTARDSGIRESSSKIADSVGTIRDEIAEILVANPTASNAELTNILESYFEQLKNPITGKQSRADVIARTTGTATTGVVQKDVWKAIGGIVREWSALSGARDAHMAADGSKEDGNGLFTVGGETTPYPAGPGLSAGNAVNCRCFARAVRVS
jgi:hypothetical protein